MSSPAFLLTYLIEGDSYTSKQRSKRYFVHFSNFVSMLLANEENVAFFRLFDDLTINIPSAIKVWTSDGLSVLTLCFKKWKTIDFLLSLKDPSRWVERGGSGSRDIGKQYWDLLMIEVLSIVTYQINLTFLWHYLLLLLDLTYSFFFLLQSVKSFALLLLLQTYMDYFDILQYIYLLHNTFIYRHQ